MMGADTAAETWQEVDTDLLTTTFHSYNLVVWNDEVNTFDWVIETLVEVCRHSWEQAEQCSYIIHHKGKYAVKEGSMKLLKVCSWLYRYFLTE